MRRRAFILALGGALGNSILWLFGARAQLQSKKFLIGFIAHEYEPMYNAFFEGLREQCLLSKGTGRSMDGAEGRRLTLTRPRRLRHPSPPAKPSATFH